MQINLRMMNDYNGYNHSILHRLYEAGHITAEERDAGLNALKVLRNIYADVKGGKAVDGSLEIIGVSG